MTLAVDRQHARKVRRSLWTWLAVVVVVVTVLGMAVNWILVDREPQDPVEKWLTSITDGRSRQGLAAFSGRFGGSGPFSLPNQVYRAAEGRIERWEITDVDTDGSQGTVKAKVWWSDGAIPEGHSQGEEHSWAVVKEHRTGPFNDSWVLAGHQTATLSVQAPGITHVTINGTTQRLHPDNRVAADGTGGLWMWEAMPGQFTVDLPEDSHYMLSQPIRPVTVGLGDSSDHKVSLDLKPSPALWEEVDQAIEKKISDCMASTSMAAEGCPASQRWAEDNVPHARAPESPMATPSASGSSPTPTPLPAPTRGSSVESITWDLVSRPALQLVRDDDSDSPLDWKAAEHASAKARLNYVENGSRVEEIIEFPVHVAVSSDGSTAQIHVSLD
ncbi:MAG: hypothetical protein Q4C81_00265 [Kocuria sp.]|nr:hypothetical protein [Kocuria sp.]